MLTGYRIQGIRPKSQGNGKAGGGAGRSCCPAEQRMCRTIHSPTTIPHSDSSSRFSRCPAHCLQLYRLSVQRRQDTHPRDSHETTGMSGRIQQGPCRTDLIIASHHFKEEERLTIFCYLFVRHIMIPINQDASSFFKEHGIDSHTLDAPSEPFRARSLCPHSSEHVRLICHS